MEEQLQQMGGLVKARKYGQALKMVCSNPPYQCKDEGQKREAAEMVLQILSTVKDADIDAYLNDLTQEEADVLFKYVFRGFETGENCGGLLKWHAAITAKYGVGSIVRAMSARRVV